MERLAAVPISAFVDMKLYPGNDLLPPCQSESPFLHLARALIMLIFMQLTGQNGCEAITFGEVS
jgi:hypothetical protein